jgi:hypothetical protein
MAAWRLHYEANPSPLDPPSGVKYDDNALLKLLEMTDGLARLFDRYPEDLVGIIQERIARWRFPREAPLGDQVDSVHFLTASAELLVQVTNAWACPLFDLDGDMAAQLQAGQARKDAVIDAARADVIGSMRESLTEMRDVLSELLAEAESA